VIANALEGIDKGENTTCLKLDIESLVFHKYEGVDALLSIK